MTDEERAREIAGSWFGDDGARYQLLASEITQALSEVRADQREKDAKLVEPKKSCSLWTFGDKVADDCAAAIRKGESK